jgi:hypothetical protein
MQCKVKKPTTVKRWFGRLVCGVLDGVGGGEVVFQVKDTGRS